MSPSLHSESARPPNLRGETGRKALHLFALVLPAGMVVLDPAWAFAGLVSLALFAVAVEIARGRSASVHRFIDARFGWMMRAEERVSGSGFCGATWVVVTAALLFGAFDPPVAATGMAMALTGDASAAIFGRAWGRTRWPGSSRTVEGTIAFIAAALFVAAFIPGIGWAERAAAAAGAAAAEALPIPLNDNLVLPFVAAGLLALAGA